MNYTIIPSKDGKYIILKVQGEINRQRAINQNLEAHALGEKLGINRYLVDVTMAGNTDTIVESYDFAYKDMKKAEGINQSANVAVLVSNGDHSHDVIESRYYIVKSMCQKLNKDLFVSKGQKIRCLYC